MTTLTPTPAAAARSRLTQPVPVPDFVMEGSLDDNTFIVGPCHQAAADWLRDLAVASRGRVGEGIALEYDDVGEFILSATRAGFSVQLRL